MAKCEKCGQEYPDGAEHVCQPKPEENKKEGQTEEAKPEGAEEKKDPA
jgi:hypothetical protein